MNPSQSTAEVERIRAEYADRERRVPHDRYSLHRSPNLFAQQQKNRLLLKLLDDEGVTPIEGRTILDVGCGEANSYLSSYYSVLLRYSSIVHVVILYPRANGV